MVINVTDDKLASLIMCNKDMEDTPEPYRGNADNTIIVGLSVYNEFIDKYLSADNYWLTTDTPKLKHWRYCGDEDSICRSFYRDMSVAIMKEIWYVKDGGVPTTIVHHIDGVVEYSMEDIIALARKFIPSLNKSRKDLFAYLRNCEYDVPVAKLVKFDDTVTYASILYAMSYPEKYGVPYTKWSFERS